MEIPSCRSKDAPVRATGRVRKRQAVRPVHPVKNHTCRVTFLQPARRAAVLGQTSISDSLVRPTMLSLPLFLYPWISVAARRNAWPWRRRWTGKSCCRLVYRRSPSPGTSLRDPLMFIQYSALFQKYFFQKLTTNFQITKLKKMYKKFRLRIFWKFRILFLLSQSFLIFFFEILMKWKKRMMFCNCQA